MCAEISPSTYLHPSASLRSKLWKEQHKTQGLYWFGPPLWCNTLLQCVVWGIASWADDDEQYKEEQPREGLFLAGGEELLGGVQSPFSLSLLDSLSDFGLSLFQGWPILDPPTLGVASPIYRQRPWASSQILSGKGANNWPF